MHDLVHISEPASWEDIRRRFAGAWIALVAIDWSDDDGREIRTAFVAGHGDSKRQARAMARPLLAVFAELGCFHTDQRTPALPPIHYAIAEERDAPLAAPSGVLAFA
jgi:hypothetical protein